MPFLPPFLCCRRNGDDFKKVAGALDIACEKLGDIPV
jgi:hypothetical protein